MFKLTIKTDNAAFEDHNLGPELGDIITAVAGKVSEGEREGACYDVNGNRVGEWKVTR